MAWDAFNMYWSCLYCGTPTYNMDSYCSDWCKEAHAKKLEARKEEKRKKSKQQKSRC